MLLSLLDQPVWKKLQRKEKARWDSPAGQCLDDYLLQGSMHLRRHIRQMMMVAEMERRDHVQVS
jgi:hypothetical protein